MTPWKIKKEPENIPLDDPEPTVQQVRELPSVQKFKQSIATPKISERVQVVRELPVQAIRDYQDKDGTNVHFITIEEALTMMLNQ